MKKILLTFLSCLLILLAMAQPKPKPKQPVQPDMNKMMEEAMKDMSPEEKAEMKKMMKDVMPALTEKSGRMADYPDFTSNKELVPKKDIARIASISKKKITQADMSAYATNLYSKIMAKGDAAEVSLVKSILPKTPKANDLSNASVLCMMQGHPQAAMALSMKAVQASPANVNLQNNMAALLTQYGYPEQAIPILQKLKNDFPYNSTVLNNLGMAWFNLGVLDSAKKFTELAIRVNPFHPEAKVCGGIIEEINGDPVKATKDYTEAIENSADPFIDKILKNKSGDKGFEKIDFEKLKRSITIYEYFPKDWIKIPQLSDNVSGYEHDKSTKNGFNKMMDELTKKIETMQEAADHEIETLMNKEEGEFAKEMKKESMKGVNKMSLTAVTVLKILQIYIAKQTQDDMKEYMDLQNKKDAKRSEMTKSGNNDKCPDFDRKNNEYLAYINPLIRDFHAKRIERFRSWLNVFCTWVWYLTGNPKNVSMMQCVAWTAGITEYYKDAFDDQEAIAKSCVNQNTDGSIFIPTPEIPNFSCPTIVKVPVGPDWQELSNAAKNFDINSLGIKNNPASPVPNHTLAFGGFDITIAQPGKAPFVKTANGSTAPGMINENDDAYLAPLSKIPLEELSGLPDLRRGHFLKDLLNKMMTADCNNIKSTKDKLKEQIDRMGKGVKELEAYEHVIEQIKKLEAEIEQKETDAQKKEQFKKLTERVQQEVDKMDKYEEMKESHKRIEDLIKEMDQIDEKNAFKNYSDKIMSLVDEIENTPAILKDIQQNGIQPSINSGVQAPGTFTANKALFQ